MVAYRNSKLANVLFTRELARWLGRSGVVANCLHPGGVRNELGRELPLDGARWRGACLHLR
jgi:NAD(P)-dependent dehydrogenase (short-subunit alcohol dehydrogenase family)